MNWGLDLVLPCDMAQLNLSRSQAINQVHYEPGDFIFRQGDVGNFFYVIANGQVEIMRRIGNQVVGLASLGRGEHFGEAALMQGKRRNASARAVGPVDLIVLGHDDFNSLAVTWLKFTESIQALAQERESDPAFASRLFEASQDLRTAFVSSFFNNAALPLIPVLDAPPPKPPVVPSQPMSPASPLVQPDYEPARINSHPGLLPNYPGLYQPPDTQPSGQPSGQPNSNRPPVFRPRFVRSDGAELPLNLDQVRIGRSPDNPIVLSDKQASRMHALLTRQNGTYVLSDQHTSNGTFVNGQSVQSHPLKDGDRVKIGSSEFVFRSN